MPHLLLNSKAYPQILEDILSPSSLPQGRSDLQRKGQVNPPRPHPLYDSWVLVRVFEAWLLLFLVVALSPVTPSQGHFN